MSSLLYKKHAFRKDSGSRETQLLEFTPNPIRLFMKGEFRSLKNTLVRLNFWFMTYGKAKIYYLLSSSGCVMHTSYVLPKCFKFPFLAKGEYCIGPCFTYPTFRGQGIYPTVLNSICQLESYPSDTVFYMVVSDTNTPSVRGIEKAGFERCGRIKKTRLLKRYFRER